MSCQQVKVFVSDLVDGYLSADQEAQLRDHLDGCGHCRAVLAEEEDLRRRLEALPKVDADPGFLDAALARATRRRGQWAPYAMAAAIALATLGTLITAVTGHLDSKPLDVPVALNSVSTVNLVFNAPRDLEDVGFTVVLPADVELLGHPGERRVVWRAPLHAGANLLALPVIARRATAGTLTTYLEYHDQERAYEVWLRVEDKDGVG